MGILMQVIHQTQEHQAVAALLSTVNLVLEAEAVVNVLTEEMAALVVAEVTTVETTQDKAGLYTVVDLVSVEKVTPAVPQCTPIGVAAEAAAVKAVLLAVPAVDQEQLGVETVILIQEVVKTAEP